MVDGHFQRFQHTETGKPSCLDFHFVKRADKRGGKLVASVQAHNEISGSSCLEDGHGRFASLETARWAVMSNCGALGLRAAARSPVAAVMSSSGTPAPATTVLIRRARLSANATARGDSSPWRSAY